MDHGHHVSNNPDVVDGFESKSFELLEYINTLESKLEQQRREFKQKERQLEGEKICVQQKLEISQHENARLQHDHHNFAEETERTIQCLRTEIDAADSSLRKERRRVHDLDNNVADLKQQLLQKQQFYDCRKAKDEKEMCRLEEQVNMLRKKVSLGWILGRLSEAYLRMESPQQQQGGGERSEGMEGVAGIKAPVNTDRTETLVRCLIESRAMTDSLNGQDAASAQERTISSHDKASEFENDAEFNRRLRNLRSIRTGESKSPLSRNVRKHSSNAVSPSSGRPSCIEIITETETLTRRGEQKENNIQPGPGATATVQRSQINPHSKSPPRAVQKSSISSVSSPQRSPCKKDIVRCNVRNDSSHISCEAALHSSNQAADKDTPRRQIHKLISNMNSKTKITSTTNLRDA